MKSLLFIVVGILMLSCSEVNQKPQQQVPQEKKQIIDILDSVLYRIDLKKNISINDTLLIKWFKEEYLQMDFPVEISKSNITKTGIEIYDVRLTGEAPNILPRKYTFIYKTNNNSLFLLPIEINYLFNINSNEMAGGYYNYREFDYYQIFRIEDTVMRRILDSREVDNNEVRVGYYRNDECIEYSPQRLIFNYNPQSHLISFSGNMKNFCEGKKDRSPKTQKPFEVKKTKINFSFIKSDWVYDRNSNYYFW